MDSVYHKIISLSVLIGLFCSCHSQVEEAPGPNIYPPEFLSDSTSLIVYPRVLQSIFIADTQAIFEVNDLSDVAFMLSISSQPQQTNWYFEKEVADAKEMPKRWHYKESRLAKVRDYLENSTREYTQNGWIAPWLYDCGIREPVRIIANETIFGREPGSNLSDLCHIVSVPSPDNKLICSFPDNNVLRLYDNSQFNSKDARIDDYFVVGSTLFDLGNVSIAFNSAPQENPDPFTLTVEIPIVCNYWFGKPETKDFMKAIDWTMELPPVERVLSGSTTVSLSNPSAIGR